MPRVATPQPHVPAVPLRTGMCNQLATIIPVTFASKTLLASVVNSWVARECISGIRWPYIIWATDIDFRICHWLGRRRLLHIIYFRPSVSQHIGNMTDRAFALQGASFSPTAASMEY